ncbi:hypothetical protein EMN47_20125 [Prolixibacteraceae bacterium JC049]|nr:hypothetical protein [Prolixibacteraceae bacterium JC049]
MNEIIKKNVVIICAVVIYVLLKFINLEIFPDYLKLSSIDPTNYFALIIGSTASIFGVLIAVILLTFQFVKTNAFRRKDGNILTKAIVTNLVGIAVSIIILTLLSYLTIHDFKQSNNLSIAYFHGMIFIGFIISIYPAAKEILGTANTLKNTIEEIQNLTIERFVEVSTLKNDKFISKKNNLPLIRVRQELLNYVSESDYEAYTLMLVELNNKAIEIIGSGQNRELTGVVFRGATLVWNAGNFEALRVGNYQFYETIWECIEELYEYAAKEKIYLLHFEELDFFLRDYVKFLARNKLGDSLSSGAKVFSTILKQNLKFNCPPQEEINDLYFMFDDGKKMPHHIDSSIQWDKINEFIYLLNNIQTTSIEIVDKELFDTCRFELEYIVKEIGWNEFPNIKVYQEAYIVQRIIAHQTYNGFIANDENLYKESMWSFHIDTSFISNLIKEEKFYVGRILEDISDFIIKSQRKERLDNYISLNYWGALGRQISKVYLENETAQIAMKYILDTFDKLKEEIENNQLPYQAKNYNEIKKQCESLKQWLKKDNEGKEIPIIERTEKIIDSFQEVTGETDFRIVKWNK